MLPSHKPRNELNLSQVKDQNSQVGNQEQEDGTKWPTSSVAVCKTWVCVLILPQTGTNYMSLGRIPNLCKSPLAHLEEEIIVIFNSQGCFEN